MSDLRIVISVTTNERQPSERRLGVADRYEERARQSIDTRERRALFAEADRIRGEEYGR